MLDATGPLELALGSDIVTPAEVGTMRCPVLRRIVIALAFAVLPAAAISPDRVSPTVESLASSIDLIVLAIVPRLPLVG